MAQQPTVVREVSFLRQGDQIVWITTENGVTTVKTETRPLEAPQNGYRKTDFSAMIRDAMEVPANDMSVTLQKRGPRTFKQTPAVEATPLPARTTVTTHEAVRGQVREVVQKGPPFGFEELTVVGLVAAFVIGGLAALLRRSTRPA